MAITQNRKDSTSDNRTFYITIPEKPRETLKRRLLSEENVRNHFPSNPPV